ncbi:MAG: hypothetical protein IT537_19485 [Hyphomicrobiales bacterium]|nr:hypothetical protein [Hyphomicrobiales bacterium]
MNRRESFDAELEDIRSAMLALEGEPISLRQRDCGEQPELAEWSSAKRLTVTSGGLTATAYQLAGYAIATLALGRSLPEAITLAEAAEYDLGRCSELDLDTIWTVGNLSVERKRDEGMAGEPGPTVVIVKLESDEVFHVQPKSCEVDADTRAQSILAKTWAEIVRVAHLLVEKGSLSRAEIEVEAWQSR